MASEDRARCSKISMKRKVDQAKVLMEANTPLFVFDLETTGLSRTSDRILSFSALKVLKKGGLFQELDRMDMFINPEMDIPEAASRVNHITNEMVKDCPTEDEAAVTIREFLGERPFLAGYNSVAFDEGFMNAMYNRVFGEDFRPLFHLDVYLMAKEKLDIPKHNLGAVSHELGTDVGLEFHNSIDDVIATTRNLSQLLDEYEETEDVKMFYETPVPAKLQVRVRKANYWKKAPNHMLQRIYIVTEPDVGAYYDIYNGSWIAKNPATDIDRLKTDTLSMYHCIDEKQLVSRLR